MRQRQLGKSDIQVSSIIMGLWQAGKEMWVGIDDKQTSAAIRAAYEAGITTFDTAEAYGKGHSEMILASALSDVRDKVIYATKVFANHLKYDQVLQACDRSLKNLQTDYIDLYQIHGFDAHTPIEETLEAPGPRELFVERARHYSYDGVLSDYARVLTQVAAAQGSD